MDIKYNQWITNNLRRKNILKNINPEALQIGNKDDNSTFKSCNQKAGTYSSSRRH